MKKFAPIAAIGLTLLLGITLLAAALPYLANTFVLPRLLQDSHLGAIRARVLRFTPWNLDGELAVGKDTASALSLPLIGLRYTPLDLAKGRVSAIVLEGAALRLRQENGTLRLADFNLPPRTKGAAQGGFSLPLAPRKIILRNCRLVLERPGGPDIGLALSARLQLTFNALATGGFGLAAAEGNVQTHGLLDASLHVRLETGVQGASLHFTLRSDRLADLSVLLPSSQRISGAMRLAGKIGLGEDLTTLRHLSATATFPELLSSAGPLMLRSSKDRPMKLSLAGNAKLLHFRLVNLEASTTTDTRRRGMAELAGDISFGAGTTTLTGAGSLKAAELASPVELQLDGSMAKGQANLKLSLAGKSEEVTVKGTRIRTGPYTVSSLLHRDSTGITADEQLEVAAIEVPKEQLELSGIAATLHLGSTPRREQALQPGRITIDRFLYRGEDIAGLRATLAQTDLGLRFEASVNSHLSAGLALHLDGAASLEGPLVIHYELPSSRIDRNALPGFLPLPAGLSLAATVSAHGVVDLQRGVPQGQLFFHLAGGKLDLPDKKLHATGIATDIALPHLPLLASSPSQVLSIGAVSLGKLHFTNGKVLFRLENATTLFLEHSRFSWCHGTVESGALRLSAASPELTTTLYCDRLQFSELLTQLGVSQTEGNGSLNGRLPLRISHNGLFFDDGFLFSTPGDSGIVRFNSTEMLRRGMAGMQNTAVLDYSIEAMENFAYNWTRLNFNSQGDNLLVSMQIYGQPTKPLPYGYQGGQLVAETTGPGLQQPIQLDVNFHLPFTKMLKYGQSLQHIMEKMQ